MVEGKCSISKGMTRAMNWSKKQKKKKLKKLKKKKPRRGGGGGGGVGEGKKMGVGGRGKEDGPTSLVFSL
jgi:hypothetical protein